MRHLGWTLLVAGLGLAGTSCGQECTRLDGSECDLISCAFDTLRCERYPAPNEALKVTYTITLEEGREYTAVLVVDLENVAEIGGWSFEGQEFTDRVEFYRLGENQWPPIESGKCVFSKGGEVGSDLEGKCSFRFDNGYNATAGFCCTLVEPDLG